MRTFFILIVFISMLWAIDAIAFSGRYGTVVWQGASYQGQKLNREVEYWLRKYGL